MNPVGSPTGAAGLQQILGAAPAGQPDRRSGGGVIQAATSVNEQTLTLAFDSQAIATIRQDFIEISGAMLRVNDGLL